MENLDWINWPILQTSLVFILPAVIGILKKRITSLDGPAAYWWSIGLQVLVGFLAALQGNNPMLAAEGLGFGFATVGYYEGGKRLGLAGKRKLVI